MTASKINWGIENLHTWNPALGKRLNLRSRHGGDPSEWPEDLRVREIAEGMK